MSSAERRDPGPRLHVLAVNDDVHELDRIRQRLEEAGFRVSTSDIAENLTSRIAVLEPDLLLLDILMPGLTSDRLASLLKSHGPGAPPYVVLQSRVAPGLLRTLIDTTGALGIIRDTQDNLGFTAAFKALVDKLPALEMEHALMSERRIPLSSGMHRIRLPEPLIFELSAQASGSGRR